MNLCFLLMFATKNLYLWKDFLVIRLIENRSFKILRENVIFLLKDAH